MANDPINQQQFEEDVLAAAGQHGFVDPNGNFKLPSVEEVWKLIEQMDGISDEERAKLREHLYNPQDGSAEEFLKRYAQATVAHTSWDYMIFIAMIVILLLIFAEKMTNSNNAAEQIIEQLKQSAKSIIEKTGTNKFAHEIIGKIHKLQLQLEELSNSDKAQFIHEMKDSFRATIDKIETKLLQHAQFEKVYNYSIFAAIIFLILFTFALFGYKLYKSLMEKELKKQEKFKLKQSKKSKKAN